MPTVSYIDTNNNKITTVTVRRRTRRKDKYRQTTFSSSSSHKYTSENPIPPSYSHFGIYQIIMQNMTGEFHHQQRQQQEQPKMLLYEGVSLMANDVSTSSKPPAIKKKRNFPGTPDPNAEVIALSPTTLMTRNRFICEICNKGFQRDQNLQLHRRGHNLPWKLRQRSTTAEVKKKVYVCPETSCVHHHPTRALGDLTGIKKHFCRKHGEKRWKCDKCSKRYAVQSDWKAHSKTCGTREYKCDCGTVFSRRDSFVTHRAFCEALAEESNKMNQQLLSSMNSTIQLHQISSVHLQTNPINTTTTDPSNNLSQLQDIKVNNIIQPSNPSFYNGIMPMSMSGMFPTVAGGSSTSSCHPWSSNATNPIGSTNTSATALLQKAAQMGSTNSGHTGVMSSSSGHVPFQSHHHLVGMDGVRFAAANKYGLFDEQRMEVGVGLNDGLGFFSTQPISPSFDGNKKIGNTGTTTKNTKYCDALTVDFLGRRQ